MKSKSIYQKMISTNLLVVYLFVAFFSQNFHNHGSGLVYKDFQFKKLEKTINHSKEITENEDCLSCHLFFSSKAVLPQKFNIKIQKFDQKEYQNFYFSSQKSQTNLVEIQLRGPPVFI